MTLQSKVELQGLQFLEHSDKTLSCLDRYQLVRSMFRRINIALPSFAAVEWLFSIGGMICTAKRNCLKID